MWILNFLIFTLLIIYLIITTKKYKKDFIKDVEEYNKKKFIIKIEPNLGEYLKYSFLKPFIKNGKDVLDIIENIPFVLFLFIYILILFFGIFIIPLFILAILIIKIIIKIDSILNKKVGE